MFFSPFNRMFLISIDYIHIYSQVIQHMLCIFYYFQNKLSLLGSCETTNQHTHLFPTIQPSNHLQKNPRNPTRDLQSIFSPRSKMWDGVFWGRPERLTGRDRTVEVEVGWFPLGIPSRERSHIPSKKWHFEDDDFPNFPRVGYVSFVEGIFRSPRSRFEGGFRC